MSKLIALIDADGPLYAAALAAQVEVDGELLQMTTLEEACKDAVSRIDKLISMPEQVGLKDPDEVFVILSSRDNFRKTLIDPTYKSNRKKTKRPLLLDDIRGWFLSGEYTGGKVLLVETLEADDVCCISAGNLQKKMGVDTVIISPDKDLLQAPGWVITPHWQTKPYLSEVSPERASRWHLYQTLVGDSADGYKGLPGYGPKKAEALLTVFDDKDPVERWEAIVKAFEDKGLSEEDALRQARLARMLQPEDWCSVKKEVILWQPPQ